MEPEAPPPAFVYYYVGEDSKALCADGFDAVVEAMRIHGNWRASGGREGPGLKAWRAGPLSYTVTLKEHPAYPSMVVYFQNTEAAGGWAVAYACGYGDETGFRALMAESGVEGETVGVYRPAR